MTNGIVTCTECLRRLLETGEGIGDADQEYEVGNRAKNGMGHALYFTHKGKLSLCAAKRRMETVK